MSVWNDYKSRVRTNIIVPKNKSLLTENQWAKKHYVKIDDKCGKFLWINAYCPSKELYLWDEEVRPMTDSELSDYRAEEKRKRTAKRQALSELKEAEKQEQFKQLRRETAQTIVRNTFSAPPEHGIKYDEIVIDTETTGLNADTDELLQVSIIDSQGNTLFDSYIKPLFTENWDGAMAVNHITPEMVANAPNILEVKQEINRILNSANIIVGYNTNFDLSFLSAVGIENSNAIIVDVMILFAEIYGEWSEIHNDYKWQKLTNCAEYYGYDWGNSTAHNSLNDCQATLYAYNAICKKRGEPSA